MGLKLKKVKQKNKDVPNNVKKALALATCLRLQVSICNSIDPRIASLGLQAANAANVFERVAGKKAFVEVVLDIDKIWKELNHIHETKLNSDGLLVFIKFMCMLIPRRDFRDFFNMNPFQAHVQIPFSKADEIAKAVVAFDTKVNDLYSLEATVSYQDLMLVYFSPRVGNPRVKIKKERDKSKKSVPENKTTRNQRKYKERKEHKETVILPKIRERIAEARASLQNKKSAMNG